MAGSVAPILPLSFEDIAQIKSSTTINNLVDVVLGLVCNSLDANASKIRVSVDFSRGSCVVEDDGFGIPSAEFAESGGLIKPYYTSRSSTPNVHGHYGTFLTSVAALSLLTVTSRAIAHCSANTLIYHHSKLVSRLIPTSAQYYISLGDYGTLVSVRNLFGNMPVRVKQRASVESDVEGNRECEDLHKAVVGLLLAWHASVSVSIRNERNGTELKLRGQNMMSAVGPSHMSMTMPKVSFDLDHVLSLLTQAAMIQPECRASWIPISAVTSAITIRGAISLDPAPNKNVQYISVGINPIRSESNTELYEEVNRIFSMSRFGVIDDSELDEEEKLRRSKDGRFKQDGFTNKQLKVGRKGADRWPMFYLQIRHEVGKAGHGYPDVPKLQSIIAMLGAMVTHWLAENNYRPTKHRGKKRIRTHSASEKVTTNSDDTESGPSKSTLSLDRLRNTTLSSDAESCTSHTVAVVPSKKTTRSTIVGHDSQLLRDAPIRPTAQKSSGSGIVSAFHSWRRIKSSRSEFFDEAVRKEGRLGSVKPNEARSPATSVSITPGAVTSAQFTASQDTPIQVADPPQPSALDSCSAIEPGVTTSVTNFVEDEAGTDVFVPWTHPVTDAKFILNTRSGALFADDGSRAISTASAHHQIGDHLESMHGLARKSLQLEKSLPTSDPRSTGPWISGLLEKWVNPVFKSSEAAIPQLLLDSPLISTSGSDCCHAHTSTGHGSEGIRITNARQQMQLSSAALHEAEVISQVDKKFILVKMASTAPPAKASSEGERKKSETMLVLIDQHAADERCKVEGLLEELCSQSATSLSLQQARPDNTVGATATLLQKPIIFQTSKPESELLQRQTLFFAKWGILYDVAMPAHTTPQHSKSYRVAITSLPLGILERCTAEPKIIIDLLRSQAWNRADSKAKQPATVSSDPGQNRLTRGDVEPRHHPWLRRIGDCPQGIIEMLNSRACRSAIMFNDVLSLEECRMLVQRLAKCAFPFQCAHGRPSMVPLVTLGGVEEVSGLAMPGTMGVGDSERPEATKGYVEAFREWQKKDCESAGV